MKFDIVEVRGCKYEIDVSSDGTFSATIDGYQVQAPTLEQVRKKLIEQSKRKQKNIRIPFAFWEQEWNDDKGKIRKGVCVGMHAGNDNLLVKMDDEKNAGQMTNYGNTKYVKPEDAAELEALSRAVDSARKARDKFLASHTLDLRDEVWKALGAEGGES